MVMRTVTVVRQYLAAVFLIVIGLMAPGCGDTASVNQGAQLASLTVTPGTLSPTFSGGTTQYNVQLNSNVQSVTVTAQPAVGGDTVTINGQNTTSSVITLGAAGTTTPVNIVVSGSGANPGGYTVHFVRAGLAGNNSLQSLAVSPGTPPIAFNENTLNYTVDVANNVGSITVTPTLSDTAATMTVNGQPTNSGQAQTITLGPAGQPTNIPIVVTAQNGNPKTYQVTVSRGVSGNNNLQSLGISPGGTLTPAFSADTVGYTVNVGSNVSSVTVTAAPQDGTASLTITSPTTNGQGSSPRSITLEPAGSSTPVFIVVTAQNGTQKTYTVGVNRAALGGNNNLSALTVSPGTLAPTFNANTLTYSVDVANNVESISVTPTRQNSTATIAVNGQAATSGQARTIPLNPAGQSTNITIVVTAQNSSTKPYTVTVSRGISGNNNLRSLTVSPGTLTPAFNAGILAYTVNVASTITSVTVRPTLADVTAGMTVNGQATNSGQAHTITLNEAGSNTFVNILVTAQNGTQRTYSVNVTRTALGGNNNLSTLTVSPGTLDSAFSANDLNYTVNVGSDVTSVNVSATKADQNAVMSEDVTAAAGTATGQATIQLGGPGTTTPVLISVTAPNGNSKTYRINVVKAALASNNNLSALSVTPGTLTPRFAAGTLDYSVNVGTDVDSVTVTATKADSNAVISGDLPTQGQATIQLDGPGTSKAVSIIVTAPSGAQKTYTITVNRAAPASNNNLSALSVTPGPLSPAFAADTLGYTVNVASDVTSVAISATKADSNAVISGDVPNSGQANITLSEATTPVSIIVTAPSGASKTYSIDVIRAAPLAPPAPISAPDLIPQDDSGFLPGQDSDNITNVNTPRFRISQPGSGETPNLYVDGVKVDSTFNRGANTLKPTSALSDGQHTITSTVTNAGGESPQSPPLPVTIDTVAPGFP
ncbi:MAG: hypothetical protein OJF50_005412 [Nitrospira sp.]|nr:hypothetical protein [Nitrospira sp.]